MTLELWLEHFWHSSAHYACKYVCFYGSLIRKLQVLEFVARFPSNKEPSWRKTETNPVFARESLWYGCYFLWCSTQLYNLLFLAGPHQICGLVVPGNQKLRQTEEVSLLNMFPSHFILCRHSQLPPLFRGGAPQSWVWPGPVWGPFRLSQPLGSLLLITFLRCFCNWFIVWNSFYGRLCGENWEVSIFLKQPESHGRWSRELIPDPFDPVTLTGTHRCAHMHPHTYTHAHIHMCAHIHTCVCAYVRTQSPGNILVPGALFLVTGADGRGSAQEICRASGCLCQALLGNSLPAQSSHPHVVKEREI